jgi:hypothetical protein
MATAAAAAATVPAGGGGRRTAQLARERNGCVIASLGPGDFLNERLLLAPPRAATGAAGALDDDVSGGTRRDREHDHVTPIAVSARDRVLIVVDP